MRELPILTNCGVSSFSNSALFKLRERRFSVRIRVIFSCSEREMTQLHILTRLDAEQHLRYEPSERLCQALTELRGKLRQLRFESRSNFAIVHRGTPPWWFGFLVKTLLPRISSPPTSQSPPATDLSRVRLSVLQILGKLLNTSDEIVLEKTVDGTVAARTAVPVKNDGKVMNQFGALRLSVRKTRLAVYRDGVEIA